MENHPLGNIMEVTMTKIREMVDVDTVVGNPITTPDGITLIPISTVSFGFASGGSEFPIKENSGFGGGNGAGVRITPIGFLVIREGNVRMLNISPPAGTTVDRLIELIPDVMDRVQTFIDDNKKTKE
jgi:sporulation protein YtfJ